MRNNKEPIYLSTWIVVGVAVIFIAGYFGFQLYNNFPKQNNSEISDLQQQINDLKNRPPEVKTETVIKEVPQPVAKSNDTDYSSIIAEWQDRVARVECTWMSTDYATIQIGQGSGILANIKDMGVAVVTNQHVILGDKNGAYVANICNVEVYGKGKRTVNFLSKQDSASNCNSNNPMIPPFGCGVDPFVLGGTEDWAYIKLDKKYGLSPFTDAGSFDTITSKHLNVCSDDVLLGDKLVILGYPAIGTQGGITATEGIVSGFEGDYYVTSAKIDHGNSGGAAILLKDDCYLGIPTWANSGSFESLGRILKSNFALSN